MRARTGIVIAVAATLALAALAPAAGLAATWVPVTGPTSIIQQIGQLKTADGTLHVVWARDTPGGGPTQDIVHVAIGPDGTVGAPTVIANAFSGVSNPGIVATASGLQVFFGAIQCTSSGCPLGLFTATSGDGGATWTTPTSLFDQDQAYASDVNAATLSDGTPFETWWHTTGTTVHRGVDPAAADYDYQGAMGAGCCGYYSNLAADGNGHMQLAWDSNATGFEGVWSQAVEPTTGSPFGSPMLMPGSVTPFNGTPSHSQMGSRTPIVALPGADNVYFVAYPTGYPSRTKVSLWQVGSATSTTVVSEPQDHHHVSLAADSSGGLWVFWASGDTAGAQHVFTRRASAAGLGPILDMGAPAGTQSFYALDGSVTGAGEPQVLALAGLTDGTSGTYFERGGSLPAPVLGKAVNVAPVKGTVFVKVPGSRRAAPAKGQGFVPLSEARQLPVGSLVDARRGTLQLTAATGTTQVTQRATLSGALFSLAQSKQPLQKGLTTFKLLKGTFAGAPSYRCGGRSAPLAHSAKLSKKVLQTLHASDKHGRFRTQGRYSAATVRGTAWDTTDRCDGTLTVVKRGTVSVTDFRRRKTITLHAGQRYLAKAG